MGQHHGDRPMENGKLYVVVRSDLPPGARAAQLAHTALAFALAFPEATRRWHDESNNIVLLEVPDETALCALAQRARVAGVPCITFTEPDLSDATTGVALGPTGYRLVSNLPLAFRDKRAA